MSAQAQRSPINFAVAFEKTVASFEELSESKKRDLELQERLEAERRNRMNALKTES